MRDQKYCSRSRRQGSKTLLIRVTAKLWPMQQFDNPLKVSLVVTIRNLAWGIRARSLYFHRPYLLRNRDWCVKRKEKQRTHWLNNWASPKPSTGKSKERRETGKLAGRTLEGLWITSVKNNSTKVLQRRNHI